MSEDGAAEGVMAAMGPAEGDALARVEIELATVQGELESALGRIAEFKARLAAAEGAAQDAAAEAARARAEAAQAKAELAASRQAAKKAETLAAEVADAAALRRQLNELLAWVKATFGELCAHTGFASPREEARGREKAARQVEAMRQRIAAERVRWAEVEAGADAGADAGAGSSRSPDMLNG